MVKHRGPRKLVPHWATQSLWLALETWAQGPLHEQDGLTEEVLLCEFADRPCAAAPNSHPFHSRGSPKPLECVLRWFLVVSGIKKVQAMQQSAFRRKGGSSESGSNSLMPNYHRSPYHPTEQWYFSVGNKNNTMQCIFYKTILFVVFSLYYSFYFLMYLHLLCRPPEKIAVGCMLGIITGLAEQKQKENTV